MKWLTRINLALLCLLAVSTGMVKLFQMPAEMKLFAKIGFADWMTIGFGLVQIGAGLALLHRRARTLAAGVLLISFIVATSALFVSGIVAFGVASFLFMAMAVLVLSTSARGAELSTVSPA